MDTTIPDNNCLNAPANVPVTVVRQSPVFTPTRFVFGGTDVGTTQYLDAHLRASFWKVLGARADDYHVLLDPVQIMDPLVMDVPAGEGTAITDSKFFEPYGFTFSFCAPLQLISYGWFDTYLGGTINPGLAKVGIGVTSLPIFLSYNGYWVGDVTNLFSPGALGYHNINGYPLGTQTYAVVDFDRSGLFGGPPTGLDTEVLSHEVAEWGFDPYIYNGTPSWGNTGQDLGFCQDNLEVGDPLSGTDLPPIVMPNGHTYYLQELAFFSWFYGPPSIAANGWYSNNGTFLTDSGPLCP